MKYEFCKTLIHMLYDEWLSNGGHFKTLDADIMFHQAFSENWEDTSQDIFNRLLTGSSELKIK